MTLDDPQTTPIVAFLVAFYICIVCKRKDFKFGPQVDHS